MDTLGVFIKLCPAAAAPHVGDLRNLSNEHLGLPRQGRGFSQRNPGIQTHADQQGAFVERRQKRGGKKTAPQRRPR